MATRRAQVRAKAAETLGDEGYRNAVDPLISALHEDEAEEVRAEAVKALATLKGEKAVDALIKALKDDESALVREAVNCRFGESGRSESNRTTDGGSFRPQPGGEGSSGGSTEEAWGRCHPVREWGSRGVGGG